MLTKIAEYADMLDTVIPVTVADTHTIINREIDRLESTLAHDQYDMPRDAWTDALELLLDLGDMLADRFGFRDEAERCFDIVAAYDD